MMKKEPALSADIVKSMSEFYKRDLITVPVVKVYAHQSISQRCGLRAATIELDTAAHPNIEYVAGTRLSVYPVNSDFNVQFMCDFLLDDLHTIFKQPSNNDQHQQTVDANYNSPFWIKFIQSNRQRVGGETLRLALTYLIDLTNFPSRELLRYIGECCSNKAQRQKMESIVSSEESWERYLCQEQRTLRSVLEEFDSAKKRLSAKKLIIQELLPAQQPRQYSISNIKSSKRFRAEIIVFQHKFSARQIALNLRTIREHEQEFALQPPETVKTRSPSPQFPNSGRAAQQQGRQRSPAAAAAIQPLQPRSLLPQQGRPTGSRLSSSIRSFRSVATVLASPISSQQVHQLPVYSGPLMTLYATSNMSQMSAVPQSSASSSQWASKSIRSASQQSTGTCSSLSGALSQEQRKSLLSLPDLVGSVHKEFSQLDAQDSKSKITRFDGLCSNYLLNLQAGDHILCEFVENPRFTLKGNRERPIMMIAQDVGLVAFRPFWQQRQLEHDRAQVFYSLFKDLSPKRFGDMQLVCLTGNKCKIEELFKREIHSALANKIIASATYINRQQLIALLDLAASASKNDTQSTVAASAANVVPQLQINSKELLELGNRIYKLLVENNGCLYTCCDPHMTQAIEILLVECFSRYNKANWTREQIMLLLPKWKGRKERNEDTAAPVFQLENTFERAQIVQEIYDSSI